MNEIEWRQRLGALVRDYIRSPELERYFAVKMTRARAAVMVKQQSLFVRHRRECWAHVSANCPVMAVKQKILEHEYEEIIRDEFSEYGHLDLIVRQGRSVGLEPEDILRAEPLPETRAVLYAWSWMTSEKSWIEGLAALTVTEWCNDDRLLADLGGGQSTRMARKWMEELGFSWKEIPNLQAHSQADEKHSDMFLPFLKEFATGEKEKLAVQAAKDSLALNAMFRKGIALAQEKIPPA
ncbi:MAG TPA: iron-containing redox enzyme family protein [candidate division Zixibacteria bacterium]|nr:iron-containing redox enzyme family protein [candidate division Zixibacteria bacterium]